MGLAVTGTLAASATLGDEGLDVINEMLGAIGEYSVADLNAFESGGTTMAAQAERVLLRENVKIQSKGWHENTELDVELKVPVTTLTISNVSGTFTIGETVTGDSSSATGLYSQIDGTTMYLVPVSGTFEAADNLTGADSEVTAVVDADGVDSVSEAEIVLTTDIIRADSYGASAYRDVCVRGGKLYDRADNTFDFSDTIYAKLVRLLDFPDLTPDTRAAVAARAARKFQAEIIGDRGKDADLKKDEDEAHTEAVKTDAENADYNILDTETGRRVLGLSYRQRAMR